MTNEALAALIAANYTAMLPPGSAPPDPTYCLPMAAAINAAVGGASANHSVLNQLAYAVAGHTGFQPAIGYTPENVANKDTDGTLAANSDVKYPSQKATKTYADAKIAKTTNITALNETGIADGQIALFNKTNKDIRTSSKTIVTTLGADDTTVPTSKAVKDVTDGKEPTKGADDNYVTDDEKTVIGNTSGVNTGDEDQASIKTKLGVAASGVDGYLAGSDWIIFNDKQDALTEDILGTADRVSVTGGGNAVAVETIIDIDPDLLPSPEAGDANKYLKATGINASEWAALASGGDVVAPATNTDDYVPQWDGADSKTLKNGLPVPIGGLAVPSGFTGAWPGASIPTGYLDCDGSAISRSTYAALFTAIGTTWGIGNGTTTFNIPDLRSATLRGVGTPTAFTSNTVIALAAKVDDKGQGHWHRQAVYRIAAAGGAFGANFSGASAAARPNDYITVTSPITDGVNGVPRTGTETSGKAYGVHHIIKY